MMTPGNAHRFRNWVDTFENVRAAGRGKSVLHERDREQSQPF